MTIIHDDTNDTKIRYCCNCGGENSNNVDGKPYQYCKKCETKFKKYLDELEKNINRI